MSCQHLLDLCGVVAVVAVVKHRYAVYLLANLGGIQANKTTIGVEGGVSVIIECMKIYKDLKGKHVLHGCGKQTKIAHVVYC